MEDEQIIDLFWSRSENALVQTQGKYGKLLLKIASNFLPDSRDVEEAAADTYLRLWNSIPPQKPSNLLAYSARICRNAAIDRMRQNLRQRCGVGEYVLLSELTEFASADSLMETIAEKELVAHINRYLSELDATARQLFVRRYFVCDCLEELARDYGMSTHAVSGRLYRIRRGLKQYLKKEGIAV